MFYTILLYGGGEPVATKQLNCEVNAQIRERFKKTVKAKGLKEKHVVENLLKKYLEEGEKECKRMLGMVDLWLNLRYSLIKECKGDGL